MSEDQTGWRAVAETMLSAEIADAADRVKTQTAIAQDALKAMLLANGGAMVALFTFVGNAMAKSAAVRFDLAELHQAFALFAGGFTLALVAHLLAFMSQHRFYAASAAEARRLGKALIANIADPDQSEAARSIAVGGRFYFGGLALACVSIAGFVGGCWSALAGVLV